MSLQQLNSAVNARRHTMHSVSFPDTHTPLAISMSQMVTSHVQLQTILLRAIAVLQASSQCNGIVQLDAQKPSMLHPRNAHDSLTCELIATASALPAAIWCIATEW